jgi:hypothetical protein
LGNWSHTIALDELRKRVLDINNPSKQSTSQRTAESLGYGLHVAGLLHEDHPDAQATDILGIICSSAVLEPSSNCIPWSICGAMEWAAVFHSRLVVRPSAGSNAVRLW